MFLYLTKQGSVLGVKDSHFVIRFEKKIIKEITYNEINTIVVFWNCLITTSCYRVLFQNKISVYFLSTKWNYFWRLEWLNEINTWLRYKQYQKYYNKEFRFNFSKNIIRWKIKNQQHLLKRYRRTKQIDFDKEILQLEKILQDIKNKYDSDIDVLRWYEWAAARIYFQGLGSKIFTRKYMKFEKRSKRPPKDPINSVLSFWYTLLAQNIYSMLKTIWFDVYCWYLHEKGSKKPILVLDLMEEWRSLIIDSLVIYLYNSGHIIEDNFIFTTNWIYPVLMKEGFRDFFIKKYQERLKTEITYPWCNNKLAIYRAFQQQWIQVTKYINDLKSDYTPYIFPY